MRTQQQLRLRNDYRVGTGDAAAVAGVGIADGSRAEYDVGIRLTPEQQRGGIEHDLILELVIFSTTG